MKKLLVSASATLIGIALFVTPIFADKPIDCTTIQDGTLTDVKGNPITMGYDQYGYNYQAHMFNGTYESVDRSWDNSQGDYPGDNSDPINATFDDKLIMKWSDDWLSNKDCTGDGKLDRGTAGISQGWLTNHAEGDYDSDGNGSEDAHYSYFVKIVWVGPGGSLWGQYEIVEKVVNDPAGGMSGLLQVVTPPGLGLNDRWTTNP